MESTEDVEDAVPLLEPSSPSSSRSLARAKSKQHRSGSKMAYKLKKLLSPTTLVRPPSNLDPDMPRQANIRYVYFLTAFVSLGAFLFGYDQGVMGVIVADKRWIDLMKPSNACKSIKILPDPFIYCRDSFAST